MQIEIPEPLPCPCCGNRNLQIGSLGVCLYGVKCLDIDEFYEGEESKAGCRLSLSRYVGDGSDEQDHEEKIQLTLLNAVLDWNKRVGAKNESPANNRWSWAAFIESGYRLYRRIIRRPKRNALRYQTQQ